jgi:hypothetical protein
MPVQATQILTLDTSIDGNHPAGAPLYLTVKATTIGVDKVRLDFTTSLHGKGEFITDTYLNLDPHLKFSAFSVKYLSGANAGIPGISENGFNLGGSHSNFDVIFAFSKGDHGRLGNGTKNFTTSSYEFDYHGKGIFDEHSFDFLSTPDRHHSNAHYLAAHIQGINPKHHGAVGTSAKWGEDSLPTAGGVGPLTPTPEPSSSLLFGGLVVGLLGYIGMKRWTTRRLCPVSVGRRPSV